MPKTSYIAFYPSRPFWAVSKVDFNAPRVGEWLYEQMAEEVFSIDDERVSLRICRDGRILIRIARLEVLAETIDFALSDDAVRRWGEYLNYLNTFYLLLDSAAIEVAHLGYFNLHEITNRDAFRVLYEPRTFSSEEIQLESIASVFQAGRFTYSYASMDAIELDPRICMRRVIPVEVITHASNLFFQVAAKPGTEKQLASFAKSLSEYKIGKAQQAQGCGNFAKAPRKPTQGPRVQPAQAQACGRIERQCAGDCGNSCKCCAINYASIRRPGISASAHRCRTGQTACTGKGAPTH